MKRGKLEHFPMNQLQQVVADETMINMSIGKLVSSTHTVVRVRIQNEQTRGLRALVALLIL